MEDTWVGVHVVTAFPGMDHRGPNERRVASWRLLLALILVQSVSRSDVRSSTDRFSRFGDNDYFDVMSMQLSDNQIETFQALVHVEVNA